MKKQLFGTFSLAALAVATGMVFSSSSCTDDTTPPVVTLVGDAVVDVMLNGTYTDEGATATDDTDNDLTVSSDFDVVVDFTTVGEYTVTYTATDEAGNPGTETRTVNVYIAPENLVGSWTTTDDCGYTWTTTVTESSADDKIVFDNFAGIGSGFTITATVSNTAVTIASQSSGGFTVIGSATVSDDGETMDYSYTLTDSGSNSETCAGTLDLQ